MRTFCVLIALLHSLFISAQNPSKTYEYSAQGFKIDFIDEPSYESDTSNSHSWIVKVGDENHPNILYMISVQAYEPDYIHSDSTSTTVEPFIDSSQKTFTEDKDYQAFATTLTTINGFLGKIYRYKNNQENTFIEARIFLIEHKLYSLYVVTRPNQNHNIYINTFFDSFQLTHKRQGKTVLTKPEDIKILYDIQFPAPPQSRVITAESPQFGKLLLHLQSTELQKENMSFVVMQTHYPKGAVNVQNTFELNEFYRTAIENGIKGMNGKLISVADVSYKKHAGKEYKAYIRDGALIHTARFFYINDIGYVFVVVTTPENTTNKRVKKFFDSFRVKE